MEYKFMWWKKSILAPNTNLINEQMSSSKWSRINAVSKR